MWNHSFCRRLHPGCSYSTYNMGSMKVKYSGSIHYRNTIISTKTVILLMGNTRMTSIPNIGNHVLSVQIITCGTSCVNVINTGGFSSSYVVSLKINKSAIWQDSL